MKYMNIRTPSFISINSFILSSILVIFIVSFSSLGFLRAPLVVLHFILFYFLILYKHRKIVLNKSLIVVFLLVVYILIQNLILQDSVITIFQAIVTVVFLFFTSQIALTEGRDFYYKEQYKSLATMLLILLPLFLISFTDWSDFRKPGLFMNPNITSHLSVMLLPFILLGMDKTRYRLLAIILVLVIVSITASRSATMALILSLLAYALVTKLPKGTFISLTLIIAAVLYISIYAVETAEWIFNHFTELANVSNSRLLDTGYNGRDVLMQIAIDRFESQPILGLGFDSTKIQVGGNELGTHNGLIEILLKFGIIGASIFTALCLSLIWLTSKHNKKFKAATVMSLAAIFSLSTNSSTFFVLNYLFIYPIILVYLGYKVKSENS